ncbi:MAG: hypothetical protein ACR2IN_09650 [Thermoleophilaceae bacterium]
MRSASSEPRSGARPAPSRKKRFRPTEYLEAGLRLEGAVAAPARVVVAASAQRHGLASRLLDVQDDGAREAGATHAVRQASPAMARLLERRGWRHAAPAGADPRFPGVGFRIMTTAY